MVLRNSTLTFEDFTFTQTANINFGSARNSGLHFKNVQFNNIYSIDTEDSDLTFENTTFTSSSLTVTHSGRKKRNVFFLWSRKGEDYASTFCFLFLSKRKKSYLSVTPWVWFVFFQDQNKRNNKKNLLVHMFCFAAF